MVNADCSLPVLSATSLLVSYGGSSTTRLNEMGYYLMDSSGVRKSADTPIFTDMSNSKYDADDPDAPDGGNVTDPGGSEVQIGPFQTGDVVGFYVKLGAVSWTTSRPTYYTVREQNEYDQRDGVYFAHFAGFRSQVEPSVVMGFDEGFRPQFARNKFVHNMFFVTILDAAQADGSDKVNVANIPFSDGRESPTASGVFIDLPDADELAAVARLFPSTLPVDSAYRHLQLDPAQRKDALFTVETEGQLDVTIIASNDKLRHKLGYFTVNPSTGAVETLETIFPDVGLLPRGSVSVGSSVQIGPFAAGTKVGLWLQANGYLWAGGFTWYSVHTANIQNFDSLPHAVAYQDSDHGDGTPYTSMYFGFEENNLRWVSIFDRSYNDVIVRVRTFADVASVIPVAAVAQTPLEETHAALTDSTVGVSVCGDVYATLDAANTTLATGDVPSCQDGFYTVPPGWELAPSTDDNARTAIRIFSYSANCIVFADGLGIQPGPGSVRCGTDLLVPATVTPPNVVAYGVTRMSDCHLEAYRRRILIRRIGAGNITSPLDQCGAASGPSCGQSLLAANSTGDWEMDNRVDIFTGSDSDGYYIEHDDPRSGWQWWVAPGEVLARVAFASVLTFTTKTSIPNEDGQWSYERSESDDMPDVAVRTPTGWIGYVYPDEEQPWNVAVSEEDATMTVAVEHPVQFGEHNVSTTNWYSTVSADRGRLIMDTNSPITDLATALQGITELRIRAEYVSGGVTDSPTTQPERNRLYGPVEICGELQVVVDAQAAVISQSLVVDPNDPRLGTIVLYTSVPYPYVLGTPQWVSTPEGTDPGTFAEEVDAALVCYGDGDVEPFCERTWRLNILPFGGTFPRCNLDGEYTVSFTAVCDDSYTSEAIVVSGEEDPSDEPAFGGVNGAVYCGQALPVELSFTLTSSGTCPELIEELSLQGELDSFVDPAFAVVKDHFLEDQEIYYRVRTYSTRLSIVRSAVVTVQLVDSDSNVVATLIDNGAITDDGLASGFQFSAGIVTASPGVASESSFSFFLINSITNLPVDSNVVINVRAIVEVEYLTVSKLRVADESLVLEGSVVAKFPAEQEYASGLSNLALVGMGAGGFFLLFAIAVTYWRCTKHRRLPPALLEHAHHARDWDGDVPEDQENSGGDKKQMIELQRSSSAPQVVVEEDAESSMSRMTREDGLSVVSEVSHMEDRRDSSSRENRYSRY